MTRTNDLDADGGAGRILSALSNSRTSGEDGEGGKRGCSRFSAVKNVRNYIGRSAWLEIGVLSERRIRG